MSNDAKSYTQSYQNLAFEVSNIKTIETNIVNCPILKKKSLNKEIQINI